MESNVKSNGFKLEEDVGNIVIDGKG
jgi:hypothetical protein